MEYNVYSGAHTGTQMENVICVQQSTYKKNKTPNNIMSREKKTKKKNCTAQTTASHLSPSEPDLLQTVLLWQTRMKNRYRNLALLAHMVAAVCDFETI